MTFLFCKLLVKTKKYLTVIFEKYMLHFQSTIILCISIKYLYIKTYRKSPENHHYYYKTYGFV